MTPADALRTLAAGDRPFFANYAERCVFAQLVMQGDARCYVVRGGEQFVRLATEDEKRISARAGNVKEAIR